MKNAYLILPMLATALVLGGCGAKPAMEGGQSDNAEYGSVNESAGSSSSSGATGQGDSTSFSSDNVEKVDEYEVRPGDNLWNIAAKASVYHSGWLYPLILKANRSKIKNASDLKIGLLLKIPRGRAQAEYDVAREEAMAGVFEGDISKLSDASFSPVPLAQASSKPAQPQAQPKAAKPAGKGGGHALLWITLLALAAGGAWAGLRMKKKRSQGAGA